ncbi:MAG: nucleotidyltransferase domain-containing protein [Planctomycetota bacterium]|nr:nucleotidyltransferase domain-containing protein [Planctomycetota bacterium]
MVSQTILARIKSILQDAFKERLAGVILYGSEARGEAGPDSDIDLLVLLNGPVDSWPDIRTCTDVLYPLELELGRPIHATPTDRHVYEAQEWRLYRFAKREGIAL